MFKVVTDHPVAVTSPDHLVPWGTKNDSSTNPEFVLRLEELYPNQKIKLCDLACAGGGMVEDFVKRGHHAVGLEGSDYSLLRKRASWATIPDNLFTCDISKPFRVLHHDRPMGFDVITCWGSFEHFTEEELPQVMENIKAHLPIGGLLIGNIGIHKDPPWHRTVRSQAWWTDLFANFGFEWSEELVEFFKGKWLRMGDFQQDVFYYVYKRVA